MVKGITWDPVGKYIASQSVDKTLRIWRTSDWTTEHVVKEPFVDVSIAFVQMSFEMFVTHVLFILTVWWYNSCTAPRMVS